MAPKGDSQDMRSKPGKGRPVLIYVAGDEDEFADHQVRCEYPQDLIGGALTATAVAVELLEQRVEPFGTAEVRWKKIATRRWGG